MNYGRDNIRITLRWLAVVIVLAMCAVITLLTGCKTQYLEVEKPVVVEHTSVQHHTDIVRDTLIMRDSVSHFIHGDTVIIERWHNTTQINKWLVADTVRDTIPVITEVVRTETKEVEKPLNWWQRLFQSLGLLTAGGAVFWLLYKIKR